MDSYWNYRVVKYRVGNDEINEEVFEVCEVYYDNNIPDSFIKDKNPLNQDSIKDLHSVVERVTAALSKPVLVWDGQQLIEEV
ncbi:hypothetical protein ACU1JV_00505 [Paenibacillus sp. T2-29]|uniref:hypothetical protein n=1 Tax=Paenibacillus TaxID=44249 RepID=UPI0039BCF8DC